MKKTVLITGGAGYIGSHTAYLMVKAGYRVVVLDLLIHEQSFNHTWATFIKGDFADQDLLIRIFSTYHVDMVMHFAANIDVAGSVQFPQQFYQNNVTKTLVLLDTMLLCNIKKIVFSSSCSVYGDPVVLPLTEDHTRNPVSPYGRSKLMIEFALQDYAQAYGLCYVSLRYFNASGALPDEGLGEYHQPETHLIPLLLRAIFFKKPFYLFGDDYPTSDGSCVRDYVHVLDIAWAHVRAAEHLNRWNISEVFNLGTGRGHSVKEVIRIAEEVCGKKAMVERRERRLGDPALLVANPSKAMYLLGWKPQYGDMSFIITSALAWEKKNNFFNAPVISDVQGLG